MRLDFETAHVDVHSPDRVQGQPAGTVYDGLVVDMTQTAQCIEAVYGMSMEVHSPMEPRATIAVWEDDPLTLYDSMQYVSGVHHIVAKTSGPSPNKPRVMYPFADSRFGCKGLVWLHVVLAAMAARQIEWPVKLVLERPQMFGPAGERPHTEQRITLDASPDGRFTTISHDSLTTTSMIEDWIGPYTTMARISYDIPHQRTTHRLACLNIDAPTFMQAPGGVTDTSALEVTLDEMVYAFGTDPVELRLYSSAVQDPEKHLPWSSKPLAACYHAGAKCFGWVCRNPQPDSMCQGSTRVGWDTATATYPTDRSATATAARCLPGGTVQVELGSQNLGTGIYTVMTQVTTDVMDVPVDCIHFSLDDTRMPRTSVSGEPQNVASVSPAVQAAGTWARNALIAVAIANASSPLYGLAVDEVTVVDGFLSARSGAREPVAAVVTYHGRPIEVTAKVQPGEEKQKFSMHSSGVVFVEVHVDAGLGMVRISRIVDSYGVGRLSDIRTGRSQLTNSIV